MWTVYFSVLFEDAIFVTVGYNYGVSIKYTVFSVLPFYMLQ
jgi:hypothetical protein